MLFHLTRFGTTWHVVVGEGFGFDISYEVQSDENECVMFSQMSKQFYNSLPSVLITFRLESSSTCFTREVLESVLGGVLECVWRLS